MIDPAVNAAKSLDASRIIKEQVAPVIQGNGGGQKILASAAGKDVNGLSKSIENVKQLL